MKNSNIEAAGKIQSPGGFFIKKLIIISAIALVLRLIAAWEIVSMAGGANNALQPLPTSDLATYMELGKACAGGEFPETFYYQPWYYAVFLPLCYLVSGTSLYMVIFVQALLSGATVFLTGWCGKKIFSDRAGLIAAGICAISSSLILYVPFHQNETLQTFHLIALFSLTLLALEKRKIWLWGITGLVAGIAILTRGNVWLIIPVILAGLLISGRKQQLSWKNLAAHAGVFVAAMLAVQLPFIIHNTSATGELTGPSTAANAVLALGNTPEAPAGGREPGAPAGSMTYPEAFNRMMANTQGDSARSVPRQMWDWFCENPLAFCELQFRKALLFWDGREIPNNVSLEFDGIASSWILKVLVFGRNWLIFALGASGFLFFIKELFQKKDYRLWMLYGFFTIFYASVVVFYILSRFKAPAIPFLTIFAGGAIMRWINIYRETPSEKRIIVSGKIAIIILIGFWFSLAAYNTYRQCEAAINRAIYPDGIILDMQGKTIHHFDYGPYPFGGWSLAELHPGTVIVKQFAKTGSRPYAIFGLMLDSAEAADIVLRVNGVPHQFSLSAVSPGKNTRRMVPLRAPLVNGRVSIEIISISGGKVYAIYDIQRQYDRSALDGAVLDGEWVIRAVLSK